MKKFFLLNLIALFSIHVVSQNAGLKTIADEIKTESLKEKVYFLASDSLEGRKTYKKGQKDAANYISEFFNQNQLQEIENTTDYYQIFERYRLQSCSSLIMKKEDIGIKHRFHLAFSFANTNYVDTSFVEYVFAGRATDKELNGLDIKNKAIVFFVDSLTEGIKKINELSEKIPETKLVLCMNDKRNLPRFVNFFKQKPLKISQVQSFKDLTSYVSKLYFDEISGENLEKAEFIKDRLDSDKEIAFSVISESQLEHFFNIKAKKLYKIARKNQKSKKNLLTELTNPIIKHKIFCKHKIDTLTTENVIAQIEGTEKKDEAIIISAHYDHVGKNYNGGTCLGADDNASGTAALMEVAAAFAKAKQNGLKPKRTVIFIAFTGEEEGLVGSWHYVNNPLFPLSKTICNINMDMIGRNHNDKVKNADKLFLTGRNNDKHKRKKTFKKVNKQYKLVKLDTHPPIIHKIMWMFGSDHHAFQMKDIPSTVIFTGNHKDYHTPKDTPDKINYEKLTNISKLVFLACWEMANQ